MHFCLVHCNLSSEESQELIGAACFLQLLMMMMPLGCMWSRVYYVTVDGLVASCELDKVVAAVDEMSWKDFCIAFGSVFHMAMYFVLQKGF